MRTTEFLRLLQGVSGSGKQYKAKCPAHEDKNPSLSICESDGKILLRCHAGCDTEKILGVLGLGMNVLFIEEKPAHIPANGKREVAAVYDYKDLDGNIIHSTVRFHPKEFRQRRPDPEKAGAFIWSMKGITPILYNLPAVTAAIKEKQR